MSDDKSGIGWKYKSNITDTAKFPKGGLVLSEISHDMHDLAKEIRVIKIWLTLDNDKHIPLILDADTFIMTQYDSKKNNTRKAPVPFSIYDAVEWIRAEFISKKPVTEGGSRLKIIQEFIFTRYDNEPNHEPTGGLWAARIFPLVKFEFPDENDSMPANCKVNAIRIDYRIHLNLNLYLKNVYNTSATNNSSIPKNPQQVGLFKDNDKLFVQVVKQILLKQTDAEKIIFQAAEKPLLYEIITSGIVNGKNHFKQATNKEEIITWDNIHAWGGYKDLHFPSAPGAFHCFHLHWRWATHLQGKKGTPQYDGVELGGPLLDPRILNQNIKLAIISNSDKLPEDIFSHSTFPFEDFIYKSKGLTPENIGVGRDLLFYYSNEAIRNKAQKGFNGSFFIQGIFFAHDKEPWSIKTGNKGPFYKNPNEPDKTFIRYPRIPN